MEVVDAENRTQSLIRHVGRVWREERFQVIVFFAVQVVVGSAGIIFALLISYQGVGKLSDVWDSYLRSGGSYVFAIALLASACATVACEFIEASRDKVTVLYWEQKVGCVVIAGLVLLGQAGLVGPLLVSQAALPAVATALPRPEATPARVDPTAAAVKPPLRTGIQVSLSLVSVVLGFLLFCLSRAQFVHDRYAKARSAAVSALVSAAEKEAKTSFDEKV